MVPPEINLPLFWLKRVGPVRGPYCNCLRTLFRSSLPSRIPRPEPVVFYGQLHWELRERRAGIGVASPRGRFRRVRCVADDRIGPGEVVDQPCDLRDRLLFCPP